MQLRATTGTHDEVVAGISMIVLMSPSTLIQPELNRRHFPSTSVLHYPNVVDYQYTKSFTYASINNLYFVSKFAQRSPRASASDLS